MRWEKIKPCWIFYILVAPLLVACETLPSRNISVSEDIQQAIDEGITSAEISQDTPLPPEVSAALLPAININMPQADEAQLEPRFDVKVRRVLARDFFLSLVEGTPYNVMIHPGLSGYISLDLKNVTVPEVMELVRRMHGYDYEREGNVYQVLPNALRSKMFHVNYLNVKRSGKSEMWASSGQISANVSGDDNGGNNGSSGSAIGSSINTQSESDFWVSLADSLNQLLGDQEGRSVTVNAQSGLLMVRAMPGELYDVEQFLAIIQQVVQRQVILEARILEVELSDSFQAGINWASLQNSSGELGLFGLGSRGSFTGSSLSTNTASSPPTSLANSNSSLAATKGSGLFTLGLNTSDFSLFIDLLKTQGDVQVLSSPRVSTVNNQKAVIKVGFDEFFVTGIDSDVSGLSGNQNLSVELTPFFSGVALDVTPQISDEGQIVLHVHPSVSNVDEQVKNITSTDGTISLPMAVSTIRESDSIIRADNGQVVVIGGLMQNNIRDEQTSIPVLGSIPILGALFRHTKKEKYKSELVILIKPVVVDEDGKQWSDDLKRSSKLLQGLD
jgi:MSHA biogenesis protein MshL